MTRRWMARLEAWPWLRRVVFSGVGLAVFVLGSTYLGLRYPPDQVAFMVIGSGWVASGEPTALRVRARTLDAGRAEAVVIEGVAHGGREIPFSAQGDDPATVSFRMPVVAGAPSSERLALTVRSGERREALSVPVEVLAADPEAVPLPALAPVLSDTLKPFRLSLVPEGAGVVARLDNRIYVKVRDAAGRSVEGAEVEIANSSFPKGRLRLTTDANGLAEFSLEANRPNYTFKTKVRRGEEVAEFEEMIVPAGRQVLLRAASAVLRPGERMQVDLSTWKRAARVYCDLRRGSVWVWSRSIDLGVDGHLIEVGPLPPGRFDLQCYFHAHTPGSTWATLPIVVGDGDPLALLALRAADSAVVHPDALIHAPGGRPELMAGYLQALLNQPPVMPTVLLNSAEADAQAREAAWDAKKSFVLVLLGGVFVLVLLVVFDLVLGNILAQRDRMRAYAADAAGDDEPDAGNVDGDELDDLVAVAHKDRESLVRTRGLVLAVLVGGTLLANLVAFIALMLLVH